MSGRARSRPLWAGGGAALLLNPSGGSGVMPSIKRPLLTLSMSLATSNTTGAKFRINGVPLATTSGVIVQANQVAPGTGVPRATINFQNGVSSVARASDDSVSLRYTVSFDFSSDARIKQNIVDLEGGVGIIAQLRLRAFEYNGLAGFTQGKRSIGVIAQELEGALPDCVLGPCIAFQPEEEERTSSLH